MIPPPPPPLQLVLASASCSAAAALQPGAEVLGAEAGGGPGGRAVGRMQAGDGAGAVLALLRLARALPAAEAWVPLYVWEAEGGGGWVEVWPRRPEWWPPQWGREEAEPQQ